MIFRPFLPWIVLVVIAILLIFCIVVVVRSRAAMPAIIRRVAMLVAIFAILLQPKVPGGTSIKQEKNLNIYFALDLTNSMVAKDAGEDSETRRYEKMLSDVRMIAKHYNGSKISILAQDTTNYTAVPLINDADTLENYLGALSPVSNLHSEPTSLEQLVSYSYERIEANIERYPERKNILFVMSDGEKNDDKTKINLSSAQKALPNAAYVIGYGRNNNVMVEEIDDYTGEISSSYITDGGFTTHFSNIDESHLQSVANEIGAEYKNLTSAELSDEDFEVIADVINSDSEQSISTYTDIYWVIALIFLGLLLWEFSDDLNVVLDERKAVQK